MLRPSMQTLKHIVVDFEVDDEDLDPLSGIPSEFEEMRSKNIIETITIGILIDADINCHQGDDWGKLDEVLTTPGWFPSLKRVSLVLQFASYGRSDEEIVQILLEYRNLPQFSRLSSSNSVTFDLDVIPTLI